MPANADQERRSESSKKRFLTNAASFFVNNVLNVTVLLWLQQYLFRRLPADEFALYPVVMSILMMLPLLSTMLQETVSRYAAEAYAKGDLKRVTAITSTLAPLCAGLGVIILLVGAAIGYNASSVLVVPQGLEWDAGVMVFLVFAIFVLDLTGMPFRVGLFIRARFVLFNAIEATTQLVRVTVLCTLLFGVSTRVLWVLVAWAVSQLVRHSLLLTFSQRLVPELRFERRSIDWSLTKILASYGWWSLLIQLAYTIRSSSDVLVLNRLSSSAAVNEFYLGSMGYKQVQRLWDPIRSSLGPPLIHMHARGESERLQNAYLRGGRIALWLMLFLAAPLAAFAGETMTLYLGTTEMWRAAVVMVILLATLPIETGNIMQRSIVRATGMVRPFAIAVASAQIFNLVVTVLLVMNTNWGGIASAIGTLTTCLIFEPLILLPMGLMATGVSFARWLRETLLPGVVPGAISCAAMILLARMVSIDSWTLLGAGALSGSLVYTIVLYAMMRAADRADLMAALSRIPFPNNRRKRT